MALLTEGIGSFLQQVDMAAAMRGVTDGAVLLNRRMLPYPGAALISMAFVTELVGAFRIDHVLGQGAVRVMAVGTHNLAFDNRMMRHLIGIRTHIPMTGKAYRGLVNC